MMEDGPLAQRESHLTPIARLKRVVAVAVMAILVVLGISNVSATEPQSEAALIEALKKKSDTRAVLPADEAQAKSDRALIDNLLGRDSRAITVEERDKLASIAETNPSVDIEINFDFNSATIGPNAVAALVVLGKALSDSALKDGVFLIADHTDAKGGAAYNQSLSEKRALAVKAFLVEQFKLPEARLVTLGYGFERLKNAGDPLAGENRRVQVVNLAE